jgi:hypothetical protein
LKGDASMAKYLRDNSSQNLLIAVDLDKQLIPGTHTLRGVYPVQTTSVMPPVVVVSGSNYDMGYQYGEQAAPLIYHNLVVTMSKLVSVYGKEGATKDLEVWSYYLWKYDPGLKYWPVRD